MNDDTILFTYSWIALARSCTGTTTTTLPYCITLPSSRHDATSPATT